MKAEDVRVCVVRIEGTNCEDEMANAFEIFYPILVEDCTSDTNFPTYWGHFYFWGRKVD